jgi:hypothetical protein
VAKKPKLIKIFGLYKGVFARKLLLNGLPVMFVEKFIQYSPKLLKLIIL